MADISYGGQAVLEGVMMRGATTWAVAVRAPSGEIVVESHPVPGWTAHWRRVPVVRGLAALVESVSLGTRSLRISAAVAEPEAAAAASPASERLMMVMAVAFTVGVFGVLPALAASTLPGGRDSGTVLSLLEGVLRIALLVGYIGLIGRIPTIRRVFEYHGAEHKAVMALESAAPLTPGGVRPFTTRHPRCGTTFLLVVMVVGVLAHAAVGKVSWPVLVASRIVLLPVVAGAAYELIKAASRNLERGWVRAAMAPGLALQALTTREPSDEQLEVSIAALTAVVEADRRADAETADRVESSVPAAAPSLAPLAGR